MEIVLQFGEKKQYNK